MGSALIFVVAIAIPVHYIQKNRNRNFKGSTYRRCKWTLKACSHVAFFDCDCDLFTCDFMKWNGLYVGLGKCSHGVICSACDAFLCAMSHMNGFHIHSVLLRCAIPICIHSKLHPHPSYHVNNFIKSHVNKSQSQSRKKRTV